MTSQTNRAPSPWPGSEYSALLDWELDGASALPDVADRLAAGVSN